MNTQTNQVANLISPGVNLMLLNAANSKGIAPAAKRAKEAGVIVIAVDVGAQGGVDATVMSDNRQAGQQAGHYIVDKPRSKGQIVLVNGPPIPSIHDRVAGAMDISSKNSDIKILSQDQNAAGSREGGPRIMTDLLTVNPKLDAVFAVNDPTAIGCDLASKQANRSEFFIVGMDGSPDGAAALKSKGSLLEATPAQDPYTMAQKAVEVGADKRKHDSHCCKLITRVNVNESQGWTK